MASVKYETMLEAVMNLYDAAEWKYRVMNMSKNRVIAIYKDSEKRGRFEKKPKQPKEKGRWKQLTIFDYEEYKNEEQ